jgi:hypothetical protein
VVARKAEAWLPGEQFPANERCGLRNDAAHGARFDGFPQSGLLELARDLIHYAYRDWPSIGDAAIICQFGLQPGEDLPDPVEC